MLKKFALLCLLIPVPAFAIFMAVGKKVNYLDNGAKLAYAGQGSIVVITRDERPYVLDGHKKPDYVGILRGGYGNTFDVLNETTHPVADDISASIANALNSAGFSASADVPAAGETGDQALARVVAKAPDHVLVVHLRNLKTDGYAHYNWYIEAELSVYDHSGNLVQTIESKLEKPVGAASGKYVDFAAKITADYREALQEWLNDAKMQAALVPGAATTVATAPTAAPASDAPAASASDAAAAPATDGAAAPAADAPAAPAAGAN